MTEDIELLRRYAVDRSEPAFASLVQKQLPFVYFTALRRTNGDVHLAEDVTQVVFTALAREARAVSRRPVLTGWLYVTTRHAAANAMRGEQRRKAREQEAHTMQEFPVPEADLEQLRAEIDPVLDELSETDRNAVLMRFFENRPYDEIGSSLQLSADAARRRVDRALEKMRGLLGRRGIVSTAAALGGAMATQGALAAPAGLAATVTGAALTAGTTVTAAAAGTFTVLGFMTTNKIVFGIAGAAAFLAAGSAFHENQQRREIAAELAMANRQRETLRLELKSQTEKASLVHEKLKASEIRYAALEKTAKENGSTGQSGVAGTPAETPGKKAAIVSSLNRSIEIAYANPEYAKMELERTALNLGLQYGPFYRKAGLTPEQIRAFEDLMIERKQSTIDIFAAAYDSGVSLSDPATRKLDDPNAQEIETKIEGLLGPKGYADYVAFSKTSSGRSSVESLASKLYYTETPVTAAQADELVAIIAANKGKSAGEGYFRPIGSPDWPTIYTQAKQVLSEEQFATFQRVNESQRIAQQQSALMQKLILEEAAKTPSE